MVTDAQNRCCVAEVHERVRGAAPGLIAPHRRLLWTPRSAEEAREKKGLLSLKKRAHIGIDVEQPKTPRGGGMTPRGDPSFPHGDHHHKHEARPTAHRLWLFSDRLLVGKPERFLFNERDFFGIAIDAPLAALRVAWAEGASGSFPHGKGDVAEPDVFTLEAPPPPGHHGKGAVWFAVHCESPKAAASLYAAVEAAIVADAEATKAHEHAVASRGATLRRRAARARRRRRRRLGRRSRAASPPAP